MIANRMDSPCSKYALKHWIEGIVPPELLDKEGDWAICDHRRDLKQVCIGLLGDMYAIPYAVAVFFGNTSDCMTIKSQIDKMKEGFGCEKSVFVDDSGMMTL